MCPTMDVIGFVDLVVPRIAKADAASTVFAAEFDELECHGHGVGVGGLVVEFGGQ